MAIAIGKSVSIDIVLRTKEQSCSSKKGKSFQLYHKPLQQCFEAQGLKVCSVFNKQVKIVTFWLEPEHF